MYSTLANAAMLLLAGGVLAGCASPGHHYWINSLEDSLTRGQTETHESSTSLSRYQHEVETPTVTPADAETAFAESLGRLALGSRNTGQQCGHPSPIITSAYYLRSRSRSMKTEGLLYARKNTRTVRFFTSR